MRWVLGLIVILGLGLGANWLLDPGSSTPLPPGAGNQAESGSETTGWTAAGAATGEAASGDLVDANHNRAPRFAREDGTPVDAAPPGPVVLVQLGEPAAPVADAQVFFVDEARYRRLRNASTSPVSRIEAPERLGMRARTNLEGRVQLPGGSGRWVCAAQHGDWFGFVVINKKPGQHTITLAPDEQVVIVAHAAGAATSGQTVKDLPIAVMQLQRVRRTYEVWQGVTDERGRAVVRHFQLLRRSKRTDQPEEFEERFAVLLRIPTTPLTMAEFAGRPTTNEQVDLYVPPLGTLQVQLVDHAGKPLLAAARIGYGTSGTTSPASFPIRTGTLSQSVRKPIGAAPVTLPYAQVGREVQLYARYSHDRRSAYSGLTKGPTEPAGSAPVQIPPLARHCVFAGRFLRADGQPLNAGSVHITIWRDDAVAATAGAETIASGLWDMVLSARTEQARWRMEFRYEHVPPEGASETGPAKPTWFGSTVEFPGWQPGTRYEFGDIVLGELPPLAAGIVVDDAGEPVAGASITIQHERAASPTTRGWAPGNVPAGEGRDLRILNFLSANNFNGRSTRNPVGPAFRTLRHLDTTTAADGTFAVFAPMPAARLKVVADDSEHFSAHAALPAPAQNLRLVIPRNARLRGHVLLPEWVPKRSITVKLRPLEESRRRRETVSTRVSDDPNHAFVLQPVRPGGYDLLVEMRNIRAPMTIIADVFLKPGDNQDPRTQPIDLRQALFRYHLEARDEAGRPFPIDGPIKARFQQPDGTFLEAAFRWQKGKAELITPHQTAELTFFGRGFVPLQQQYGPGNHEVFLTTLKPALVNVPGARALAGPIRKIRISAILQGDTGLPSSLRGVDQQTGRSFSFPRWDLGRSSGGWLEQTDLVEIPLMKAGKYQLLFRAHATESTSTPQTSVNLGTFDLTLDGSVVTVPLDAQQITDALAKIDKQWNKQWQERLQRNKDRKR